MNNLIRKFNKNRNTILLDIFIIFVVIIAIQFVNNIIKEKNKESENEIQTTQNTQTISERTPILNDKAISQETNESNLNVIDNFINLCNEKKVDEAYNLLSQECKEEVFPTQQDFVNNYYSKIFDTEKKYKYENWISKTNKYTYKIKIYEDNLMATGGQDTKYIEEYYTIIKNKNEEKLNINNFINKEDTDFEETNKNINIKVKEKTTFLEYEIYTIDVKNGTNNDILLDSKESTKTMYVLDENENTYSAYSHEIALDKLWIRAGETRTLKIKFTKQYTSTLTAQKIVFSDIILNYNEYKKVDNKEEYTNREEISVKLK